jgi:hypothetical protein
MEAEGQRMKRVALWMLAVAVLVTGCGHPLIPAAYAHPSPPAKKVQASTAPGQTFVGTQDVTGKPLLGVDLYALSNYSAADVEYYGERTLQYIKTKLKADAVGIVWNLYAPSRGSDVIDSTAKTLSPANVGILTEIAEADGLQVTYRPLIFVSDEPRAPWEGRIQPRDPDRWFDSYYQVELPYLRLAQQFHITEFVAATEMHDLATSPGWAGFFQRIAAVYQGNVTYASWDGDYFPPKQHLLPADALGMDMYEAMPGLPASASEAQVLRDWDKYFDKMPASVVEQTTIQEIGIEARAGAYKDPANLGAPGALDQQVQANWFTAACKTVRKYNMRGVFFWKVDLTDNPAFPASSLSTFEGKQGATAIAACASILG